MPRNGSGVYTAPASSSFNPATTNQQATAPDWNALIADLDAALTQSISQDGQTTITANMPFGGFRATNLGNPVNAQDAVTQAFMSGALRGHLGGYTLSNDSGTPNTILDIAAGSAVDSTNTVIITGTAFTKTTGGTWVAGTGNAGMGNALSVAPSTWYHVFGIINNGVYDVYFDTSITAANAPANTTVFRRMGSFKTDGSSHIIAFTQNGDEFLWNTPPLDISSVSGPTSASSITLSVPTGLKVNALIEGIVTSSSGTSNVWYFSSLDTTDIAPTTANGLNQIVASTAFSAGFTANIRTNITSQVRARASAASLTMIAVTYGWIDTRGRFA
jgi:hypothetical protein